MVGQQKLTSAKKCKEPLAGLLIKWYRKKGRTFPWRKTRDSYKILIAEIMLQRTRANQVVPVYLSFLKEFPDLYTLDKASIEEIMKYFSKLGLTHRAGRIKTLTKDLIEKFNGKIPDNREDLLTLPSIGEYVSDALLCFSFEKSVGVLDSNVCRIIGRIFSIRSNGEARRDSRFRRLVDELVPSDQTKEYNWALIDLGALICKPRNPLCDQCPVKSLCNYR